MKPRRSLMPINPIFLSNLSSSCRCLSKCSRRCSLRTTSAQPKAARGLLSLRPSPAWQCSRHRLPPREIHLPWLSCLSSLALAWRLQVIRATRLHGRAGYERSARNETIRNGCSTSPYRAARRTVLVFVCFWVSVVEGGTARWCPCPYSGRTE